MTSALGDWPPPSLELKPLSEVTDPRWSAPKDFSLVVHVREVPLTDTELLQVSHYLPIAIRMYHGQPTVVAIVDPSVLRTQKVGKGGRWLPPYVPLALRCLPFWALPDWQSSEPLVATALGLCGPQGQAPFRMPDGGAAPETRSVVRILNAIKQGTARLTRAAHTLMIADLLTSPEADGQGNTWAPIGDLLTVDDAQFGARSGRSLSAAMEESFLPLNLAGACRFSRRHFGPDVKWRSAGVGMPRMETSGEIEAVLSARQPLPVGLDSSETIDIAKLLS